MRRDLQIRHLRATRAVPAFYTLLLLDQLAQSSIPDLLSSVLFSQNGLTERSGCREQQKGVICRDAPHFSVWHASVCPGLPKQCKPHNKCQTYFEQLDSCCLPSSKPGSVLLLNLCTLNDQFNLITLMSVSSALTLCPA